MVETTEVNNSNSVVYTDTYTIAELSTDDGREYRCEVVINSSPPVMGFSGVTLNVICEYVIRSRKQATDFLPPSD